MSYGADGNYTVWNKDTRSKYSGKKELGPGPITSGDFSENGLLLAFAVGYDWSKGANGINPQAHQTHLYLRTPK